MISEYTMRQQIEKQPSGWARKRYTIWLSPAHLSGKVSQIFNYCLQWIMLHLFFYSLGPLWKTNITESKPQISMVTGVPACIVWESSRQAADSSTKTLGWSFRGEKKVSWQRSQITETVYTEELKGHCSRKLRHEQLTSGGGKKTICVTLRALWHLEWVT